MPSFPMQRFPSPRISTHRVYARARGEKERDAVYGDACSRRRGGGQGSGQEEEEGWDLSGHD